MPTEITDWIIDWFKQNSGIREEELREKVYENYFERGWLDSLKFIGFISEIESHFNIAFLNEEFQDRSFATIDGLSKIIRNKIK